jgi:putative ABC transport system permease protein
MDTLFQDLKFALRLLAKDRAFAATTILTLALCIGANTAIFTVVRSVLLRPLPYAEANRLVFEYDSFPGAGVERAGTSVPNYFDRLAFTDILESQALYRSNGLRVGTGPGAEDVPAMEVTSSFFTVLRARAVRGRLFTEADGEVGHNHVVLLSHAFAAKQPGGMDGIVGRDLRLNDEPYLVVGVLSEGFAFLDPEVRIFTPLAFDAKARSEEARHSQNHQMIGRLAAGATVEQARARIDALNQRIIERAGPLKTALINARYRTIVVPLEADIVRNVRAVLNLLWGGALFVLLIAAVNITNLALVRASGRLKEVATRHALGAARRRVARQLVTEAMLLTIAGGVLGLMLGWWSLGWLTSVGLADVPRSYEVRFDAVVFVFILGLAFVLGLVIGAVPSMQLAGLNLSAVLRDEGRSGTAGRGARRARRGLVVTQVGLAFVLLVSAGLLLASFRLLLRVDPGFSPDHVLTGRVTPLETKYPSDPSVRAYAARTLERIRALPGVTSVGLTTYLPFSWDSSSSVIIAEGYTPAPGESVVSPNQLYVSSGYLETMRVPLRRGRYFLDSDKADSPRVVIIDEQLAQKFWPNVDPIGRRMYKPNSPEDVVKPGPDTKWMQVVGVAATVKLQGLIEGERARVGAYYIPLEQETRRDVAFAIRTTNEPGAITPTVQRALAEIDPELQMSDVFTMQERVEKSLTPQRTPMVLSMAFASVALLLAAIGIYGVLAYEVSQRTREFGIRMALGSDARKVLGLVLREGVVLVVVGLAAGVVGAALLRRLIASQLYGVGAFDPMVLLAVTGVLALVSFSACLGPARRAATVDPSIALGQQ